LIEQPASRHDLIKCQKLCFVAARQQDSSIAENIFSGHLTSFFGLKSSSCSDKPPILFSSWNNWQFLPKFCANHGQFVAILISMLEQDRDGRIWPIFVRERQITQQKQRLAIFSDG
jgi:hypothetical protein